VGPPACSHALVKLATWNCCGKFGANLPHLLDLGADVAVVCEASATSHWPATSDGRQVTGHSRRVWQESGKELAVVACEPWTASIHEAAETAPAWTLPVRIDGPTPFVIVGPWPVVFPGAPSYVAQIEEAINWIAASADGPVVLAGDFNAPIAATQRQYDRLETRLCDLGLVDVYRVSRALEPGELPTEATYYQHRKRERPFHIDHVMVPADWASDAKVEIGDFGTWVATGRSDHVPVIAAVRESGEVAGLPAARLPLRPGMGS
jgi:hypothetical protein